MSQKVTCSGLLCQKVQTEETTGFLSVINIVTALNVNIAQEEESKIGRVIRGIKAPLYLVLVWNRDFLLDNVRTEKLLLEYRVDFLDPTLTVVISNDQEPNVIMEKESDVFYSVVAFPRGIMTSLPGRHRFRVFGKQSDEVEEHLFLEQSLYIHMFDVKGKSIK